MHKAVRRQGPVHALRGTGESEKMLKNARTEFSEEHEEIAMYAGIEALADTVGDKETAKLARGIRREEERMANFLGKQIPTLAKAVAGRRSPPRSATVEERGGAPAPGAATHAAPPVRARAGRGTSS